MAREWLQTARADAGLTQQKMSEILGISESYYGYIETGKRQKTLDLMMAEKIGNVLHMSVKKIAELEKQKSA